MHTRTHGAATTPYLAPGAHPGYQVEQIEPDPHTGGPVPVTVTNIVTVTDAASVENGFDNIAFSAAVKILPANPKRRWAAVWFDQDVWLGRTQPQVTPSPAGAQWPANVPLTVSSAQELWATPVTTSQATNAYIVEEAWTR